MRYTHAEAGVESIPVVADRTPGEVSRNLVGAVHSHVGMEHSLVGVRHSLVGVQHSLVGMRHSLVGVRHNLGVIDKVVVCPITEIQHT